MNGQRTIVITGATDGIGLALAQHYHTIGERLVLIGRRSLDVLDPHLFTPETYCRVDLAQPFAAPLIADWLGRRAIRRLDLLIHNAGIGAYSPPAAQTSDSVDALLDTNLRAPIALTHALLPLLVAAHGRVVFIGSVAAALPVPDYAVYGATKAALEGFARSLRVELRGQVGVQVVHPGATRTAMHTKIGVPLDQIGWQRFPSPDRVAGHIVRAIAGRKQVVTIGSGNRLLRFAGRQLGSVVDRVVVRREEAR